MTLAVPDQDQARIAVEGELLMAHNSFEQLRRTGRSQSLNFSLLWLPGYLEREQRIYNNFMGDCLAAIGAGNTPTIPQALISPTFIDYLAGRTGPAMEALASHLDLGSEVMDANRRRAVGVALAAGISAYWARHKSLPNDFAQVRAVAEIPSDETLTSVGAMLTVRGGKAEVFIPCQFKGRAAESYLQYGARDWYRQDSRGLTFTI